MADIDRRERDDILSQIRRFGGAAIVNTIFGYSMFALLVAINVNIFLAQILAQIAGVLFNFQTYKRAFRDAKGSRPAFFLAYFSNYLVGVALLALLQLVIPSPYIAGFLTVIIAAGINFVVLKSFVFRRREVAR